jgi:hypothetical protein
MSDEITTVIISEVLAGMIANEDAKLYAKQENELGQYWYWKWDEPRSIEWNTYRFSDLLEMYKRTCRQWEEKHNGICCVVERVRDKYVMPKVREFLVELARHNTNVTGLAQVPAENVEQDAARYRWLRDRMQVLYKATMSGLEPRATLAMRVGHEFLDCRMNPAAGWVAPRYFDECRAAVDAAIDDAMKMPNF